MQVGDDKEEISHPLLFPLQNNLNSNVTRYRRRYSVTAFYIPAICLSGWTITAHKEDLILITTGNVDVLPRRLPDLTRTFHAAKRRTHFLHTDQLIPRFQPIDQLILRFQPIDQLIPRFQPIVISWYPGSSWYPGVQISLYPRGPAQRAVYTPGSSPWSTLFPVVQPIDQFIPRGPAHISVYAGVQLITCKEGLFRRLCSRLSEGGFCRKTKLYFLYRS